MKPIGNIFGFDCVTCEHNRHCYGGNMGNQFRYCQKSTEKIQNLDNLEKQNKQLKEENAKLKLKPLQGIFAQVTDDQLLRSCGAMQQEVDNYKSILTKLEEWLKETRINSAFIDEQTIMEVQLKIQELKEKYK